MNKKYYNNDYLNKIFENNDKQFKELKNLILNIVNKKWDNKKIIKEVNNLGYVKWFNNLDNIKKEKKIY